MTTWKRASVSVAAIGALALVLAGCSTGRVATRNLGQPEQLQPIQDGTVASANLPTIGQSGQTQTAQLDAPATPDQINPALTGQPVLGGQIGDPVQTASADGSFVTLDSVGAVPNAPGRDLSGGLTIEKLLGGWTIVSGAEQCKLNLTYTAKTGTSRYRASTPGCQLKGLNVVASWHLAGSQVQLFDENGDMIAALILSGNRFIGTLAGGQGISMVG
ncbi:MAG: AprI/Inh family metalloprotease inhibitor [Devosia sp.]|nr:AprI/Inh family metalloprotease inhibitor [Devosia sp.]